jgi:N-acetylmuramoyl-L-alanine amidase
MTSLEVEQEVDRAVKEATIVEAEYALSMVHFVASWLRHSAEPFVVELTRCKPTDGPTLDERGARTEALGADLVLSLHVDANPSEHEHGAVCYYWPGNAVGLEVAHAIAEAMPSVLRTGKVFATTDNPDPKDDWLKRARNVLKPHKATAVLVEVGRLTSEVDRPALLNSPVQSGIALAIITGVIRYRVLREV